MATDHRSALANIKRFDQLIKYLRDEMGWPIAQDSFEDVDDLFYDFTADELGIDPKTAAKITEIKRLKPLSTRQPWGIFFVKFEPRKLPVVALRRILSQVAMKKRASANSAERTAWAADDLLFVSNYGEGDERQISFAHFSKAPAGQDLPTLKVLGWDNLDTALHLDAVAKELTQELAWPKDEEKTDAWRARWRGAFTLRHGEVVTTSKELSTRLAKLAGDIRDRIKAALAIETNRGPLTKLLKAFQTSLVHDLDADGFADMYAQTIAYGLLSARIADPQKRTVDDFAGHMRTNPFLRELMETFLKVGGRRGKAGGPGIDFDELGVSEVVQLLDDANMEAVVLDFGDKNPQEDPVIHFYELFLKAYDAKKRMQRGVFYTPRPVVSYIVRSVDELLRTEFGLEDGLADTTTWGEMAKRHKGLKIPEGTTPDQAFVQILDPATGTGTFLVEVIDIIHRTMAAKWRAQGNGASEITALWNEYVPEQLLKRLHAYELLMAPYAIAHLKVGLKLYETGYRFCSDERARIYLTNALEPASDNKKQMEFAEWLPALAHEAQAVNEVKRKQRFTVVIGNPPYSGLSANMDPWIDGLLKGQLPDGTRTASYYQIDGEPLGEKKVWLQDDYVKFTRLSQWLLSATGCGLHGFITNHGYFDNPTFRGMRWSLMDAFDDISVLDLHGNLLKKETALDGSKDVNVFDIQQGVGIGLFTRKSTIPGHKNLALVQHTEFWGARERKYNLLLEQTVGSTEWRAVDASKPFYLFEPFDQSEAGDYFTWPTINDVMPINVTGVVTARDDFVIDFDRDALMQRITDLRDTALSDGAIREKYFGGKGSKKYPPGDSRGWKLPAARQALRKDKQWQDRCAPILYRPFDTRHIYYVSWMVDWPRTEAMPHMLAGENVALITCRQQARTDEGWAQVGIARSILESCAISNITREINYAFPLWLYPGLVKGDRELFAEGVPKSKGRVPNLDPDFVNAIDRAIGLQIVADQGKHLSPTFNPEEALAYIFAIFHSPEYRRRFAPMLKLEFPRVPMPGNRAVFRDLARLGGEIVALLLLESPNRNQVITTYTGPKNPEVGRVGWSDDTVWVDAAAAKKGQLAAPGTIGFRGVPEAVWKFHIGGYQVCEKWLKDRKGRTLSKDDIAHYQKIVVALNETIRLMKEIDVVIEQHGGWPGAFQTGAAQAAAAKVIPFRPRIVQPGPKERYVTCVPLVPLKAAAGAFGDPQRIDDDGFEWAAVETKRRLRPGMFVAQVVGKSMEPAIPDGAYCLFAAPVEGTRQGKTVLVQLRDATDPESGDRYTVKRYESEKAQAGDSWRHEKITLKPVNPDFKPIVLTGAHEGELQVVAEFVEVLGGGL